MAIPIDKKIEQVEYNGTIIPLAGGATPTGTINISATSVSPTTVDVTNYANANVSVGNVTLNSEEILNVFGADPDAVTGKINTTDINNINITNTNAARVAIQTPQFSNSKVLDYYNDNGQDYFEFYSPEFNFDNISVIINSDDEAVNIIENGKVLAYEPKSYYSVYSRTDGVGGYSATGFYFNGTITPAAMSAFFNSLPWSETVPGTSLPCERLLGGSLSESDLYILCIDVTAIQSGLKVLGIMLDDGTFTPVYSTQNYDLTSIGWGTGIQGWQNLDYEPGEEISFWFWDPGSLPIKDIVATQKVAFGSNSNTVIPYLTIQCPEPFILADYNSNTSSFIKGWDGTIEYSLNKTTWNTWTGTSYLTAAEGSDSNYYIYLRGTNNTYLNGLTLSTIANCMWVFYKPDMSGQVNGVRLSGNMEVLLDYQTVLNGQHPTMDANAYAYMFQYQSIVKAPELPAITLTQSCYQGMFYNCVDLRIAPKLPADNLATDCYDNMFYGCTSLTTAPALLATNLARGCYHGMFNNCTSLTTAPALPATTLAEYCYRYMFKGCTSLTTALELPATTLARGCYFEMFNGCTSLTTAPELPATTLADYCYDSMFYNCASLTTPPTFSATTLAEKCCHLMFRGCTSLTTAPALPATTLADSCYHGMFNNCTSLTIAPELPATTLADNCYARMFNNCTNLIIPPVLPATTLAVQCYAYMFYGCTALITAPELPVATLADSCYSGMFASCSSLTTPPALPATVLAYRCYLQMFNNCTSLTTAPELPATTLATECYQDMFYGCTSLQVSDTQTSVAPYPWRIPASGAFNNTYFQNSMFWYCAGTRSSEDMPGEQGQSYTYYTQNQPV